jgi:uncharacterized protein (TIGR03067 family)
MRWFSIAFTASCLLIGSASLVVAGDDTKLLQGVSIAQWMEVDGKPAPAEKVKRVKFTFKGDKLIIAGNFDDDLDTECVYRIDPKKSPKHLEFTLKSEDVIPGIYEMKGDDLKVCLRHSTSTEGRPSEFATKADH